MPSADNHETGHARDSRTGRAKHADMPFPPRSEKKRLWRRPLFWVALVIALILAEPLLAGAWNIVRPDAPRSPKVEWPEHRLPVGVEPGLDPMEEPDSPARAASLIGVARLVARHIALLPPGLTRDAEVLAGRRYDALSTPALLDALASAWEKAASGRDAEIAALSRPPFRPQDIAAYDGVLRAAAAHARARSDADALARQHLLRLAVAGRLVELSSTPEDFTEALARERAVCAEIRGDTELLLTDKGALTNVLRGLARRAEAPSPALAAATALGFDAALDARPDAGLRLMGDPAPADATGFLRLAFAARKPREHRRAVSELLRQFGEALAKPTFREARRALPEPGDYKSARIAASLLRADVLARPAAGVPEKFFFPEAPPTEGFERFALRFAAITRVDDPYGEAALLRRRAELITLLALRDRTRFEAAATAYALALEYRRAENGGARTKSTESLFDGLLDAYPQDPFTDDIPAYSFRQYALHSPGADGVDRNGLTDPEFASELAQLWEPTLPVDPERPTDPKAFGLKPSDLDLPVALPTQSGKPE